MNQPKVSIIMPSLNVRDYIEECLESVCTQNENEIEIICVDAESTDGTYDVLLDYQQRDSRIAVLTSKVKSYGYQVNLGLEAATGEYVAILETDDYVDGRMYSSLYRQAKEQALDYVKADYIGFVSFSNGYVKEDVCVMTQRGGWYDRVIEPGLHMELFLEDYSVWRGIYNRQFLLDQNIKMNETPGAAFQDIGFILQVLLKAQRAMYVREAFYHYRMDREESSTFKPAVLQFAYQEFKRLLEDKSLLQDVPEAKRENLYYRLLDVFVLQYTRALRMVDYHYEDERIAQYYAWFSATIRERLDDERIAAFPFSAEEIERLNLLLDDQEEFVRRVKQKDAQDKAVRDKFLQMIGDRTVVVFGCGNYGKNAYIVCDRYAVKVHAFCDNAPENWNKELWGVPILEPEECFAKYPDCVYVIANKNHWQEIRRQLEEHGVFDMVVCSEKMPV